MNGMVFIYLIYWAFLIFVVVGFEKRASKMEKSLRQIRRNCSDMNLLLMRKELFSKGEIGNTLLDIYHRLNEINRAVNASGVGESNDEK